MEGMANAMTCLILCDECCGEMWEEVSGWIREGRASSKPGRLKVPVECRGCGVLLLEGESVEAVTLHGGGEYHPWEGEYLETVWDEAADGEARAGRLQ
jgi:hypothetical protein